MTVTIRLDIVDEKLLAAMQDPTLIVGPIKNFLKKAASVVQLRAVGLAPVDTGRLRSSITQEVAPLRGRVFTNVEYAPHVELGTRPHIIKARRARALAGWQWKGEDVIVKSVHHPGTKPKPFMRPALEQNRGRIDDLLQDAAREIEEKWRR